MIQQAAAEQPAHKIYALGPGWHVARSVSSELWLRTYLIAERWRDHAATIRFAAQDHFFLIRSWSWLVIFGLHVAARLQYLPALLLIALLWLVYVVVLPIWAAVVLLSIGLFSASQALSRRFTVYCPACYNAMPMLAYLCPTCQAEHTRLCSNVYGVLHHRCLCGTRLPTLDTAGRKKLACACPHCHHTLSSALAEGPATHIALVGASEAGKTSYLVAAIQMLQQMASKAPCTRITLTDPEQARSYEAMSTLLSSQQAMTTTTEIRPVAYTVKMQRPGQTRLLYCYDPAGAAFHSSETVRQQGYYAHCNGILFLIDPLTLPSFYERHQGEIERLYPSLRPDSFAAMRTYERLMQALEALLGLRTNKRYTLPIAMVVTRSDVLLQLEPALSTEDAAQHQVARNFLQTHHLDNLVRDLEAHFTHVDYFFCSSQESCIASGEHIPTSVLEPLSWLLNQQR